MATRKTQSEVTNVETVNEQAQTKNTVEITSTKEQTEMVKVEETPEWQKGIDKLNVEEIKDVMKYCQSRLEYLQKSEIEALETEMRSIQMKLLEMKGGSLPQREAKKKGLIIVNPNNPQEIYRGFGKRQPWLVELLKPANGNKDDERKIMEALAQKD